MPFHILSNPNKHHRHIATNRCMCEHISAVVMARQPQNRPTNWNSFTFSRTHISINSNMRNFFDDNQQNEKKNSKFTWENDKILCIQSLLSMVCLCVWWCHVLILENAYAQKHQYIFDLRVPFKPLHRLNWLNLLGFNHRHAIFNIYSTSGDHYCRLEGAVN